MIFPRLKWRSVLIPAFVLVSGIALGAAPAHAAGNQPLDTLKLFCAGPFILLLAVAFLSVLGLIAVGFGFIDRIVSTGERAVERLERGRILPTFWGISFSILVFTICAILVNVKPIALIGVLSMLAGAILVGSGIGVAAIRAGRDLIAALGRLGGDDLTALQVGLTAFFAVSVLPFLGWIVLLLAAASGIGALVETCAARQRQ